MSSNDLLDSQNNENLGVREVNLDEKSVLARFEKIQKKQEKKLNVKNSDTSDIFKVRRKVDFLKILRIEKPLQFAVDTLPDAGFTQNSDINEENGEIEENIIAMNIPSQQENRESQKAYTSIRQERQNRKINNASLYDEEEEPMIFFEKNNVSRSNTGNNINEENNGKYGDEFKTLPEQDEDEGAFNPSGNAILAEVLDWAKHIAIAVIIGILLVMFVVQRNVVIGSSMEPNLYENDQLIVEKVSKLYNKGITYEDIITINAASLLGHSGDKNIIKRVIGLSGDTIEIKENGVYRNGVKLEEKYLHGVATNEREPNYSNVKLGKDQIYVLGDNRNVSLDSRTFGPIEKSRIIGEVLIRFYPLNKFGRP